MIRYFHIQEISKEEFCQKAKENNLAIEDCELILNEYKDLGEGEFVYATRDGEITLELTKTLKKVDSTKVEVGNTIKIISMKDEPQYIGKVGEVTHIDDIGQLHGTWGGCAVIPGTDEFKVLKVIKSWEELAEIEPSKTHRIEIGEDRCNGWVLPLNEEETPENVFYLSTHTFYEKTCEGYTKILQDCGFDVVLEGS